MRRSTPPGTAEIQVDTFSGHDEWAETTEIRLAGTFIKQLSLALIRCDQE